MPTKDELKDRFYMALMVAPTLSVMLMSAIFDLASGLLGNEVVALTVVLGILTVLAIVATAVLSFLWEKRLPTVLLAVILWLCFFSYLAVVISGTSDLLNDRFFQALTLVFSLPIFSYRALMGGSTVGCLILTGLLAALHTATPIAIGVRCRREAARQEAEKQAKRDRRAKKRG
jgi:hypothetical protein